MEIRLSVSGSSYSRKVDQKTKCSSKRDLFIYVCTHTFQVTHKTEEKVNALLHPNLAEGIGIKN